MPQTGCQLHLDWLLPTAGLRAPSRSCQLWHPPEASWGTEGGSLELYYQHPYQGGSGRTESRGRP